MFTKGFSCSSSGCRFVRPAGYKRTARGGEWERRTKEAAE